MKDKIIARIKTAYTALLEVYNQCEDPVQKSYLQHELMAMRESRTIIKNAFDVGGDGRYAIIEKIDNCMEELAQNYDVTDYRGEINGYATALALFHDNEIPV